MPLPTSQLAQRGLEIKAQIRTLQAELDIINGQLVNEAAGQGNTITLPLGRVIVTQQTEARPSGVFNQIFQKDVFNALPETSKLRKDIIAKGIVTFEQGTTSGRAPVVQYTLNA